MKGVEKIKFGKKLLAIIFKKNIMFAGVKFFTDENNPFQVGIHFQKAGVTLAPHIHKLDKPPHTINTIQEILMIERGKIRVTIFSESGKVASKKVLTKGDSVLFLEGGHGVDFLEDSKVFLVKQGPFKGTMHAKIYLNDSGQ